MYTTAPRPGGKPRSNANGFTLLEVLIALIVLSIGLLGLASLQANGLKHNHSAYLRSQAVTYAYDIIDRMRANHSSAVAGNYSIAMTAGVPTGTSIPAADLAQWLTLVAGNLPAGDAETTINGRVITVTVQWDDTRAGGEATEKLVVKSEL
ncbi:MAG: type IV pilus modification protein PilV [Thiogranum sp.]|nr:type IV pilus modification protein PilV [Thiogranum sp.]